MNDEVAVIISYGHKPNKVIHFSCSWCGCEWLTLPDSCNFEQVDTDENGAPIMEARARCPCCGLGVPKNVCQKDIFEDL